MNRLYRPAEIIPVGFLQTLSSPGAWVPAGNKRTQQNFHIDALDDLGQSIW
jgi:hypothetical protein